MKKKKKITLMIIGILLVALIAVGTSYAYWKLSIRQQSTNRYASSCFNVSINLDDSPITLNNAKPISNEEGLALEPYTFTIENTCDAIVNYSIQLNILEDSTLNSEYVKYTTTLDDIKIVGRQNKVEAKINNATAYEIKSGTLLKGQKQEINLRLWMDQYTPQSVGQSKTFNTKIVVDTHAGKEVGYIDKSGAEQPDINNGLLAVTWNGTDWVKADIYEKWYDYDTQWWANAVTVSENTRNKYHTAMVNTPIEMDDIETMWVWVPRYEYQHTNLGDQYAEGTRDLPGAITINFISRETNTPSSDNFTIHDAFWWDNNNNGKKDTGEQLSGIWVAKFEMSAESPTGRRPQVPFIKPNVTSWMQTEIGTLWTSVYEYMNGANNKYGLTNTDAHLMKNMEWGAVAYLSQSKYGKYGNEDYKDADKEIYQNKSSEFITGSSNGTPSTSTTNTQIAYNIEKDGTGASTTGNIYGIYDMSGGAVEYVMGIMKVSNANEPAVGRSTTYNSGWSGRLPNGTSITDDYGYLRNIGSKYYDLYDYYGTASNDYSRGHFGDATKEIVGWYSDQLLFVDSSSPFFGRGGGSDWAKNAGIFSTVAYSGYATSGGTGGRPVLVAQPE